MVLESLSLLLRIIDRYMIGSTLGDNELGLYSASYNLSAYIEIIITASLAAAIRPMISHLWERDGADATKAFLSKSLHTYLMLGIPFIALFILVSPDMLVLLASERYSAGALIIPYICTVILLDGAFNLSIRGRVFSRLNQHLIILGLVAA